MEGGNTNEYANLVRQTDEYGNPINTAAFMDVGGRQGLSTNVGHATGGAGCHYDFGDTTGQVGFGAAGAFQNHDGATAVSSGGIVTETGNRNGDETTKNKEAPEKMGQ